MNGNKVEGIVGLTVIAVVTFWTIIIPLICVLEIISLVDE